MGIPVELVQAFCTSVHSHCCYPSASFRLSSDAKKSARSLNLLLCFPWTRVLLGFELAVSDA